MTNSAKVKSTIQIKAIFITKENNPRVSILNGINII